VFTWSYLVSYPERVIIFHANHGRGPWRVNRSLRLAVAIMALLMFAPAWAASEGGGFVPGLSLDNIPLELESDLEPCEGKSEAELVGKYALAADAYYLFRTQAGFGVASLSQSLRNMQTGVRRTNRSKCRLQEGSTVTGQLDCRGARTVARVPHQGCDYDAEVFAHSLSKAEALELILEKIREDFRDYRRKCVSRPR
jgi:hypothetical protein